MMGELVLLTVRPWTEWRDAPEPLRGLRPVSVTVRVTERLETRVLDLLAQGMLAAEDYFGPIERVLDVDGHVFLCPAQGMTQIRVACRRSP